ncbi:hypothetical protein GQ54DRAFT_306623 [Martensiomyces pterosporus]|nr:hypothetical protein GQ54DRAFT_306623 [Martensiomyces pterosporus]
MKMSTLPSLTPAPAVNEVQQTIQQLQTQCKETQARIHTCMLELAKPPPTRAAAELREQREAALDEAKDELATLLRHIQCLRDVHTPLPAIFTPDPPRTPETVMSRTPEVTTPPFSTCQSTRESTPSLPQATRPPATEAATRFWLPHCRPGYGGRNPDQSLVPSTLPHYPAHRGNSLTIDSFIALFETAVAANDLTLDVHWTRLLPSCLDADTLQWLRACLPCDLPWAQARQRILRQFSDEQSRLACSRELFTLHMPETESVLSFVKRMRVLASKAGYPDDSPLIIDHMLDLLPHSFALHIFSALELGKCDCSLTGIYNYLQITPTADRPLKEPEQPATSNRNRRLISFCKHHGKGNHTTNECRFLQKRTAMGRGHSSNGHSSSASSNRNRNTSLPARRAAPVSTAHTNSLCFYCGEPGHFAKNCPIQNASLIRALQCQREPSQPDPREMPVLINDYPTLAFANTGADRTWITQNLATDLGLNIHPTQCQLEFRIPGIKAAVLGETERVTIKRDKYTVSTQCLVLEDLYGPPLRLGFDDLRKLRIYRAYLPFCYPDELPTEQLPIDERVPCIEPDALYLSVNTQLHICLTIFDDVIVLLAAWDEHKQHVLQAIIMFSDVVPILNLDTYRFFCTSLLLLGPRASVDRHAIDSSLFVQLDNWPTPTTGKQI